MSSSKKFVSSPKSRSKKPSDPYYTRHSDKSTSLSQSVNKLDNGSRKTDPVVNQSTLSQKVYSGSKFELILRGSEIWLRTQPQVSNYNENLPTSKLKLYEIPIGRQTSRNFEPYYDTASLERLTGISNYLKISVTRLIKLTETYCRTVCILPDKIATFKPQKSNPYQNQIKALKRNVTVR